MKKHLYFFVSTLILYLSIISCGENSIFKHDDLYGQITISGRVTDIISNAPLPGADIRLNKYYWEDNGLTYSSRPTGFKTVDTTDANGCYEISIIADGQYEFEVQAIPSDSLNGISRFTNTPRFIDEIGIHTLNLSCHRTGWVRVNLINEVPIDTPHYMSIDGNFYGRIVLLNFYKDTTVYILGLSRPELPEQFHFIKDYTYDEYVYLPIKPWDTITVEFKY